MKISKVHILVFLVFVPLIFFLYFVKILHFFSLLNFVTLLKHRKTSEKKRDSIDLLQLCVNKFLRYLNFSLCAMFFQPLSDAILLLRGSLDPLLFSHWTVLQLHCTNLMKGVKYCLHTFHRAAAFYCRRRQQKTWHESADRNIK